MEDIFGNKYLLLIIGFLIFVGSVLIGMSVLSNNETLGMETPKTNTLQYKMFVKTNSIIRLDFEVSFDECNEKNNNTYACGNHSDKVTNVELINQDDTIFKDIDFKGKTILDSLNSIVDIEKRNNVLNDIKIITDYVLNYKDITDELKAKFDLNDDFKVIGITRKNINEEDIIKELSTESTLITFKVSFDSLGGSLINDQEIVQNEFAIQPVDPVKSGFIFKEWQIEGKKYDFETPITSDIILTAFWLESDKAIKGERKEEITTATTKVVQTNETKTTTTKSIQTKTPSTINLINLNDNISVYTEVSDSTCGYHYFSKGTDENNNVIYDLDKENKALSELERLKNNLPKGVKDFNYNFSNHEFNITYTVLYINNKYNYVTLYNSWNRDIKRLTDIMDEAKFSGANCNNERSKITQLNESVCSEFNLNCKRW